MTVAESRMVSSDNPMLVDFEALPPGSRKAVGTPRAARQPSPGDPAIALWNEDNLAALLKEQADTLFREGVIRRLEDYRGLLEEVGVLRTVELAGLRENAEVLLAGVRVSTAREGKNTVIVSLEDGTGTTEAVFASDARNRAGSALSGTEPMLIAGVTTRDGSLRATNAWDLKGLLRDWKKRNIGAD